MFKQRILPIPSWVSIELYADESVQKQKLHIDYDDKFYKVVFRIEVDVENAILEDRVVDSIYEAISKFYD